MTAPNGPSQQACIAGSMREADADEAMHGVEDSERAGREQGQRHQPCRMSWNRLSCQHCPLVPVHELDVVWQALL